MLAVIEFGAESESERGYEKQNCAMDSLGCGHGYLYGAYFQ
jgi:hypothetical protein